MADDNYNNVLVFRRTDRSGKSLVAVINFSPVAVEGYRFGVPPKARYEELFNTDEERWGRQRASPTPSLSKRNVSPPISRPSPLRCVCRRWAR